MKPRLLDLFCGQGGAAMGYSRAGFDVFGVDIEPWPFYPFEQVQGDALEYLAAHGDEFDFIHASPPCQAYSMLTNTKVYNPDDYADLLQPTIDALRAQSKPWVVENVPRSRAAFGILLCGSMFEGVRFPRHRLFGGEGWDFPMMAPATCNHSILNPGHYYRNWGRSLAPKWTDAGRIYLDGLGCPWVPAPTGGGWLRRKGGGVIEVIPPAYTEWLGREYLAQQRTDPVYTIADAHRDIMRGDAA